MYIQDPDELIQSETKSPTFFLLDLLTAMRVFSTDIEINQLGIVAANADKSIQYLPAEQWKLQVLPPKPSSIPLLKNIVTLWIKIYLVRLQKIIY